MKKTGIILWCFVIFLSAVVIFIEINSFQLQPNEADNIYTNVAEQSEILAEAEIFEDEFEEAESQIPADEPTPEPTTTPNDSTQLQFTPYGNVGGNSGIAAFQYGADYIRVKFSSGAIYRYTYQSAGASNIEQMKVLANQGQGLNSFINREVRQLFEAREQ